MSVNARLKAIADEIRTLSGQTDVLSLDEMAENLKAIPKEGAKTITPSKETQIAVEGGTYLTGDVIVNPIPGEYVSTTDATASADEIMSGETAYVNGTKVTGTFSIDSELSAQDALIQQIESALVDKAAGGSGLPTQEKTVEITENGTVEVVPDEGYTLSKVTANVNVEASGGSDDMAGALASRTITEFSSNSCAAIGDYSFRGCEMLTTIVAPNAESVGTYALYGCSKLKSIVLPSVTTVATNSFREASNLEVIDLPKLTAIPATAFYGCRGIKALILRSETVVTLANTNAFTQCYCILGTKNSGYNPNGEKIGFFYVPKALIEEYQAATNWSSEELVTQFRAIEDYPDICGGAE